MGFRHLNFSIFGGFQKRIFLRYDEIVDIFFGHHNCAFFGRGGGEGSFIYFLGLFLKVKVFRIGIFLGGAIC